MARAHHDDRLPLGLALAPLILRIALAATFIWAGLGKVVPRMAVDPGQAALLASMGVSIPAPATAPAPAAAAPADGATATPTPEEIKVRRMWGLAMRIHACANPGLDEAGKPKMKLWPGFLGSGNWPRYFTIAVVIAELGGGILLAIGLLTRLGAFMLAGVMIGAMWLDQIGPAVQAGNTVFLLLPAHDLWDVAAWRPLLWQFSLLCSAAALMLLGAGAPSLDRALGWTRRRGDDDDL